MRRGLAVVIAGALVATGCAQLEEGAPVPEAPLRVIPVADAQFDPTTALALAALPLACLDRPHSARGGEGYLYDRVVTMRPDFEQDRAFYGCYDWHSAVNSTWALAAILNRFPDLPLAPLIVEKFTEHLSPTAMAGELGFFHSEGNETFERPYGWAWLLALHAELAGSSHPRAAEWSMQTAPLVDRFVEGLQGYFSKLDYPVRVGTHANTAFALDLTLQYARQAGDAALVAVVTETARSLFTGDSACPVAYEPSASDFLSPCLEEAKLMTRVLEPDELEPWLRAFLDPVAIEGMALQVELADRDADLDVGQMGAKSHLIGLMFTRAEALQVVAHALPENDPLARAARAAAAASASNAMAAMFEAGYLGSHWLGTFAVKYLVSREQP